ncbi:hypothetical protein K1719_005485 [Acacia pycnantha]|nr:hypothetical protein K1719_005485 [Acacia pycnantha]
MTKIRGNKVSFVSDRLVLTVGATSANEILMFCLDDPGEAFLLPTPYYPAPKQPRLIGDGLSPKHTAHPSSLVFSPFKLLSPSPSSSLSRSLNTRFSPPPLLQSKGVAWDYVFVVDYMTQPGKEDEIVNENEKSEVMGHREAEIVGGRNKNEVELMTQDNCLVSGISFKNFF